MRGTRNLCRDGSISRGTSHATTKERYQYTTSMDINNTRYKRIQSLIQNHMRHVRSESAPEQRIALYKTYEEEDEEEEEEEYLHTYLFAPFLLACCLLVCLDTCWLRLTYLLTSYE